MATKPVITIDVDASKFDKFFELFQSYEKALGDQPKAWDALNDAMAGAGKALESGAVSSEKSLHKAADEAQRVVFSLRQAGQITASHTRAFNDFGRAGKNAWQAIGGAADASIGKMGSGLAGVLSALGPIGVGAATIMGGLLAAGTVAKTLADSAVTRQRAAFGLGTTTGKQSAFAIYGQQFFGNGQAALQTAVNLQSNIGSGAALGALGIDFNRARSMSPGDLAIEVLRQGVRVANASPGVLLGNNALLQQYVAASGDTDFDQLRNAQAMLARDPHALDKVQAEIHRNAASMETDPGAVAKAALLAKAAPAAGTRAQTWLINNTSGVDPALAKGLDALSGDPRATAASVIKTIVDTAAKVVTDAIAPTAHKFEQALNDKAVPALQKFAHTLNLASGGRLHQARTAADSWFSGWEFGPDGELRRAAGSGAIAGGSSRSLSTAAILNAHINASGGKSPVNNPLNMKIISGGNLLWGQYASVDEGIRANAKRLLQYKNDQGADTLASIIPIWNGHGANSQSYIDNVEKWSGVSRNAKLQSLSQSQFASVESAMSREEGTSPVSSKQVMNALFDQQRNTRPTTLVVQVYNSTASRIAIGVKGANP